MLLKACVKCRGDMFLEDALGDREFVCIQCGHRVYPTPEQTRYQRNAPRVKAAA